MSSFCSSVRDIGDDVWEDMKRVINDDKVGADDCVRIRPLDILLLYEDLPINLRLVAGRS